MGLRTPKVYIDNDGAICVKLQNQSGGNSVKGEIVLASTGTDLAVGATAADDTMPIGTFNESGIAVGSDAWVAVAGITPGVLDAGGGTHGEWVGTGGTARVVDADAVPAVVIQHMQEIGHLLETGAGGTTKKFIAHFN